MAATLFFPPPSTLPCTNHDHIDHIPLDEDDDVDLGSSHHHPHHPNLDETHNESDSEQSEVSSQNSPLNNDVEEVDVEVEEEEEVEHVEQNEEVEEVEVEVEGVEAPEDENLNSPSNAIEVDQSPGGSGMDLATQIERRVTLKPRRTLSLSPTPARAGDMMARNLRAARWLDFTNEDDDDGLYQGSDSDIDAKRKTGSLEEPLLGCGGIGKMRVARRGGSLTLGAMTGLNREFLPSRRSSSSMKRPLEVTLPCQEIQYLDISYQKVGINSVQFSPIPRKKIAYHPVPYHAIHYCDVPYLAERPVKRKPPA